MKLKKIFTLLLSVLCLFSLTFCSKKAKLSNDTLYFNLETEPPTLDPSKAADTTSSLVIENTMDGLTDYDFSTPDLKIIPKVAKSWKITHSGSVYTFYLRDDVYWTDGKKVTAPDFEYSWKRIIDPKTASEYAYFLFDVKNAQAFNEGKIKNIADVGIKALDDFTFQVTLTKPVAYFLHISTFPDLSPLRKDIIEKYGDAWTEPEHIITNGPFKLTHWKHDYQLILERNDNYYGAKAKLKKIICFMIVEASTALSLYQTKKLDIIRQVPPLDIPHLKNTPEYRSGNYLSTYYIGLNTKKEALSNAYVRRAFSAAINRTEITDMLQKGDIPTSTLIPQGMLGHNPSIGIPFNPTQAKEWMKKAGYGEGKKTFPPITLLFNTSETHKTIAESLQSQWKRNLGIEVRLDNQEWKVYTNSLQSSHKEPLKTSFDIFRLGWNADYPDPDNFMSLFTSYSDNNHTQWGSKTFDKIVEKAKLMGNNPQKRVELYNQAQKMLLEEEAVIFLSISMLINRCGEMKLKGQNSIL